MWRLRMCALIAHFHHIATYCICDLCVNVCVCIFLNYCSNSSYFCTGYSEENGKFYGLIKISEQNIQLGCSSNSILSDDLLSPRIFLGYNETSETHGFSENYLLFIHHTLVLAQNILTQKNPNKTQYTLVNFMNK